MVERHQGEVERERENEQKGANIITSFDVAK
jgi:hypothetical protein